MANWHIRQLAENSVGCQGTLEVWVIAFAIVVSSALLTKDMLNDVRVVKESKVN